MNPQWNTHGSLAGRGLVKKYGSQYALAGIDIDIAPGAMVAIVGPSGSGKTSLMHVLGGIVRADAGEVYLAGQRIDQLSEKKRSEMRHGKGKLEGSISVPIDGADREVVRTAVTKEAAGGDVISPGDDLAGSQQLLDDIRRVTAIGLIAACVLAGCSAAIATAGSVMDRRRTFGALMAAGTPVRVLSRALRAEAAVPALVATVGAGAAGIGVGAGLLTVATRGHTPVATVLSPWLVAPVVLGIGVALLGASVCTPVLNRVRAEPLANE